MRPEEHADAGEDGEGVAVVHARVLHAREQLEAVSGHVVVQAEIGRLVVLAVGQAGDGFVAALAAQTAGHAGAGELIAGHQFELVREEEAGLEVERDRVALGAAEAGGDLGDERHRSFGEDQRARNRVVEAGQVGRIALGMAVQVAAVERRGVGAAEVAEVIGEGRQPGGAGVKVREGFPHVPFGEVREDAGVVVELADAARERHGGGVIQAHHVGEHGALHEAHVAARDVAVVREAVLLLTDGELQGGVEFPARPEFGEAVVGRFEVAAADRLRVDGQVIVHLGLEAETDAAAFERALAATDAARVMVVAVVAAEHPEFLESLGLLVLVDESEVLEPLLERRLRGRSAGAGGLGLRAQGQGGAGNQQGEDVFHS